MNYKEQCPELFDTELWQLLEQKAVGDHGFLDAVFSVCYEGVLLSKTIIGFFPTFTLHDGTHVAGVCRWMIRLLGERKKDLRVNEAAMLLLAACWHDSGMSVSPEQRRQLEAEAGAAERPDEWREFFCKYPGDELRYIKSKELSEETLRKFIRNNHHHRVDEQLAEASWPAALLAHGFLKDDLIRLCRSHGEDLSFDFGGPADCDMNLCKVLLRLADILDYDAGRAPGRLFRQLGLDKPDTEEMKKSREEWKKNSSGCFDEIRDGFIHYTASFQDSRLEHAVRAYLDWLRKDLLRCGELLSHTAGPWRDLKLPYRVNETFAREGYEAGDFLLTMDQDRVLELLTGRNLYDSPDVFIRELLQNSIDAVMNRRSQDSSFGETDGKIVVRTWLDGEGQCWFRIEDDGVGMDKDIIQHYFLKIGRSYYASDRFWVEQHSAARQTGFTPTSRFGIGILSCFMNDPDNSVLEVVTRRYSPDRNTSNPVYRLDVTGLHGYYSLAELKRSWRGAPLPCPAGADGRGDGYLRDVGTTICVKVNLDRLGGPQALREAMDRYLCFPEVPVEYRGLGGERSYPTWAELMDAVHSLNPAGPDAPLKEYLHPLPDKLFQQIKEKMPAPGWEGCEPPARVLRYQPLDWLSDSGNVSGLAVRIGMRLPSVSQEFFFEGSPYRGSLSARIVATRIPGEIKVTFSWAFPSDPIHHSNFKYLDEDRYFAIERKYSINKRQHAADTSVLISQGTLLSLLCQKEKDLFEKLTFLPQKAEDYSVRYTRTAYNGVLADDTDRLGEIKDSAPSLCWLLTVLLRGDSRPEVQLSRNAIQELPL